MGTTQKEQEWLNAPPRRFKKLADPKGTRALVDRIRTTYRSGEFSESYSVAMDAVEEYVLRRLRMGR